MKMKMAATIIIVAQAWDASAASPSVLLQAASFALSGNDASRIEVEDLKSCIFSIGNNTWYLNNVDPSRITITHLQNRFDGSSVKIELHGSDVIVKRIQLGLRRDSNAKAQMLDINPSLGIDRTFTSANDTVSFSTEEYGRVLRAWKYLYVHGCAGAKSAF